MVKQYEKLIRYKVSRCFDCGNRHGWRYVEDPYGYCNAMDMKYIPNSMKIPKWCPLADVEE